MKRFNPMSAALFLIVLMASQDAFAVGSNMPWEQPLEQILTSIQGPVALIQIVFGLTIAFAASSFFLSFFSFGGGVLI